MNTFIICSMYEKKKKKTSHAIYGGEYYQTFKVQ